MAELAYYLSFAGDRVVLDNTGLSEPFDVSLEWTLEQPLTAGSSAGGFRPGASDGLANTGPSLFAAVQEHLGLKLDPQTGPVAVLVIDRAEKPSEDRQWSADEGRASCLEEPPPCHSLCRSGWVDGRGRTLATFRILGGPSWIGSDPFDIIAKAEGDFPETKIEPGWSTSGELMLRTLLAEN